MPDYAAAEAKTEYGIIQRRNIGVASDGYAYVHVDNTNLTPAVYVVLPGGAMLSVGGDADELVIRRRGDFIAAAINAKLSPLPPTPEPHQR